MKSTRTEAAAAARIGARLALRKRAELLQRLRPCFARTEPWLQAGKYTAAVMSELPERNGWSIARHAGDKTPDKTQRLLNHASWDTFAAMGVVRRFAVAELEQAARRRGRRRGLIIGAIDETGQEKAGEATCGVKRQYLGCAGQVANGINTVHVAYVREGIGHALIGARQWIPREHIEDPVKSLLMGLPLELGFRTKGQLAIDISKDAAGDRIRPDFYCGDEVYGNCTELRGHFEASGQAYVLRVPSNFMLTLTAGIRLTCADAVQALLKHKRRWEVRSAGSGSKGERWYAWAWLATASPRHHLLIRRHLRTGMDIRPPEVAALPVSPGACLKARLSRRACVVLVLERCGRCAPVAPDDLHESGHRQGMDAAGTATHVCVSTIGQRHGDRGDQPSHGPQFIERY